LSRRPRLEGPNARARTWALVRVALLPLLAPAEALEAAHSQPDLPVAQPLLAFLVLYSLACLVYTFRARHEVRMAPFAVIDILVLAALIYAEGGAVADIRFALGLPVLISAFLAGPRLTLGLAALAVAAFAAGSLLHASFSDEVRAHEVAVHALDLAWRCGLAVIISVFLTRRDSRIRELLESRRLLVGQALKAEGQARRELSYALHDELAQELLFVQQDLKAVSRGRPEYLDRAQAALGDAVERLRSQIFVLHPHQLEREGLAAALEAVAERQPLAGGSLPVVSVAPDAAAIDDELLFSVARELMTNAVRHAGATSVALTIARENSQIVVTCRDDGRGIAPDERRQALVQGHVGLAACTERVEALGGALQIVTGAGRGTTVRATIPADDAAQQVIDGPAAPPQTASVTARTSVEADPRVSP